MIDDSNILKTNNEKLIHDLYVSRKAYPEEYMTVVEDFSKTEPNIRFRAMFEEWDYKQIKKATKGIYPSFQGFVKKTIVVIL